MKAEPIGVVADEAALAADHGVDGADASRLIGDFIDAADRVVVRFIWRGAGQGPEADLELTSVWTVRKGSILAAEYFRDYAEALETLGLSQEDAQADSS